MRINGNCKFFVFILIYFQHTTEHTEEIMTEKKIYIFSTTHLMKSFRVELCEFLKSIQPIFEL